MRRCAVFASCEVLSRCPGGLGRQALAGGSQVDPERCGSHADEVEGWVQRGKDSMLERSEAVARRVWMGGDGKMLVHPIGQAVLGASVRRPGGRSGSSPSTDKSDAA